MDRPGVRQVPEGSGEQGKIEKTGCKIICGASTTVTVEGLMMVMMMMELNQADPKKATEIVSYRERGKRECENSEKTGRID